MPRHLTPGVFIEEISTASKTIEGVTTAVTAFIGMTARNSLSKPKVVNSMTDYLDLFGPVFSSDDVMALAVNAFFLNGGRMAYICPVAGDVDTSSSSPSLHAYTRFFDKILPSLAINIIVLPGQYWAEDGTGNAVISIAQAHCERLKNRMLIIDPPETLALRDESAVRRMALPTSDYAVFYYPWVGMANPLFHRHTNRTVSKTVNVPPSAIAAGIWSKIDERRGVWKSPAGLQLTGASSLAFDVTRFEQQQLNPLSVNCIRKFPRRGIMLWGARTLSSNLEWRYVPVRRLAIFIEESINKSIEWVVFEPNDEPLWLSLRAIVEAFMLELFRKGALQGSRVEDAFFVRVGLNETMTQSDVDHGRLMIEVGFAPMRPAEFVIVRINKKMVKNN